VFRRRSDYAGVGCPGMRSRRGLNCYYRDRRRSMDRQERNVRVGEGFGGEMTAIKAETDKQTSRWAVSQTGRQTGEEVMVEEKE
jgi:hypothetical protein